MKVWSGRAGAGELGGGERRVVSAWGKSAEPKLFVSRYVKRDLVKVAPVLCLANTSINPRFAPL